MILAGTELLVVMWPDPPIRLADGAALGGQVQQLLATGLVLCGVLTWVHPVRRTGFSIAAVLLALCALLTSDIGGFLGGTLLAAVGASLAFAWVPPDPLLQPEQEVSAGPPEAALALSVADDGAVASSTAVAG
jgi:hypothetical protein